MNKSLLLFFYFSLRAGIGFLFGQEVFRITNNDYLDVNLKASGGNLVWLGYSPGYSASQVFYFDWNGQGVPTALTNDNWSKSCLKISGDNVVWSASNFPSITNLEIFHFKIGGGDTSVRLTHSEILDYCPVVSRNHLVWDGVVYGLPNKLYYMDLGLIGQVSPVELFDTDKFYYGPIISGDHVALYNGYSGGSEVVYYNLTEQGQPLHLEPNYVFSIQFSNNKLWWYGKLGDIHYFDLDTRIDHLLYDVDPNGYWLYLKGSDDYAVWSRYDNVVDRRDIYYYDLNSSSGPAQLTDDADDDIYPALFGDYIVWQKGKDNKGEIYYYNLITRDSIVRLTWNDFEDQGVSLCAYGNKIAWRGGYIGQDSTYEIYTAVLPETTKTVEEEQPGKISELGSVFPNPVSGQAVIKYSLRESAQITLLVLDVNGKSLKVVAEGNAAAGTHQATIDTLDMPQGLYFYSLRVKDTVITKRMVVIR